MDSLGEFVKLLLVVLEEKKIPFQLTHLQSWHQLFYRLKKLQADGKPEFLERLWFDWDGQYPKSPDLDGFLAGLSLVCSVETTSPRFEEWRLAPGIAALWKYSYALHSVTDRQFLDIAAEMAREEFASRESPLPTA